MSLLSNFRLLSRYNQMMNEQIYQVAQKLGQAKVAQDQGAFFGSILGTLNHIYVADLIWLRRFAQAAIEFPSLDNLPQLSTYQQLDLIVAHDLANLRDLRKKLDQIIIEWCQELEKAHLASSLQYQDTKNNSYCKNLGELIQHFFNHQTHHRGQVSTLINQYSKDVGVTDLLQLILEI